MKDTLSGENRVRIGCFGGFWGDSMALAVAQFLRSPESDSIDFLVSDYLAEVTMCILAKKQGKKKSGGGFIDDFANVIWKNFGAVIMRKKIRVVVNAGGLDPLGLKTLIESLSEKFERRPVVAAITGDNLMSWGVERLAAELKPFAVDGAPTALDAPLPASAPLLSCNAYIGATAIAEALRGGADVVITGRCVDSAMVLGPLIAEHAWRPDDYDRLAAGAIAGHIIECGAQCTGGNFTDWELGLQRGVSAARLFENVGFPLVDVAPDGTFVVSKPSKTAGIVSRLSVAEQLVYEIGDPSAYAVPDVRCDVRNVRLEEVGPNRVRVSGVRGAAPSGQLKVSATAAEGHMMVLSFAYVGRDAYFKSRAVAASIIARAKKQLAQFHIPPFTDVRVEYLGAGTTFYPPRVAAAMAASSREVVVRITAHHASNTKAFLFLAAHIPSASTGMAPGLFSISNARTAPSEAVRLYSAIIPEAAVPIDLHIGASAPQRVPLPVRCEPAATPAAADVAPSSSAAAEASSGDGLVTVPLITIACCRSGDKGDAANIGVVARSPEYFSVLRAQVTEAAVLEHCAAWASERTSVARFELPGVPALNFVLSGVLGGGGLISLKADKQGKSLGSVLLDLPVKVPAAWARTYDEGVGRVKAQIRAKL